MILTHAFGKVTFNYIITEHNDFMFYHNVEISNKDISMIADKVISQGHLSIAFANKITCFSQTCDSRNGIDSNIIKEAFANGCVYSLLIPAGFFRSKKGFFLYTNIGDFSEHETFKAYEKFKGFLPNSSKLVFEDNLDGFNDIPVESMKF